MSMLWRLTALFASLAPSAARPADPLEWSFDRPADLIANANLESARVANGTLAGFSAWDPHVSLRLPKEGCDARGLTWLTVRLYSSAPADVLDVYYGSPDGGWCLGGKLPIRQGWAVYRLDLRNNAWRETTAGKESKQWGGPSKRVTTFRIDPGNQADRWIMIDFVRLEPEQPGFAEGVKGEPRGAGKLNSWQTPTTIEAGATLNAAAQFDIQAEGLSQGTAFVRLRQGATVMKLVEQPVALVGGKLTVSAQFEMSRYWNPGAMVLEAGCYELDTPPAPVEVAFTNRRAGATQPPACELRPVGGDPAIFVNGQPVPGFLYLAAGGLHPEYHREAAQAGVHLYSDWFGTSRQGDLGHVEPGSYDYGEYDRYFGAILDLDPQALFLPHIGLSGPLWWQKLHPEEMSLREDGRREPTSFASELWKREMGDDLRKLLAYLGRAPYADRILGYILYSGYTAEWQMWGTWQPSRDDYSAPALRAFRGFLARRYGSDPALRAAWNDPGVALSTAEMPRWDQRRPPGNQVFRDPATERQAMDFYEFASNMTADAILHFARIAREATHGRALLGTYYAYLSAHGINQQDSGHLAAQRVFDSPDIDFLMSPPNYWYRKPGEAATFMSATDSLRMRGKLWLDESDHRTHLTEPGAGYGRAANLEESVGVFWREFAEVQTKRAAVSWFDMHGGWFSDPGILAAMQRAAALASDSLPGRKPFTPEIGVFVDPESFYWMRSTPANSALVLNQIATMPQSGAPWDFCLLRDIAKGWLPDYKLYVFLNAFRVDSALRDAVVSKLKRNGATALFIYAPGWFDANGTSLSNMQAFTGIRIAKQDAEGAPQIRLVASGAVAGAANLKVAPVFSADDPEAQILGHLTGTGKPGLVSKRLDGWTSIYSAAMSLPPSVMRSLARQAGVHIWIESDDALYTDGQFAGIHAASDGDKRLLLPRDGRAEDAITGQPIASDGKALSLPMKRTETALLRLLPLR